MKIKLIILLLLLLAAFMAVVPIGMKKLDSRPLMAAVNGKAIVAAIVSSTTSNESNSKIDVSTTDSETSTDYFKRIFANPSPALPEECFSMPGATTSCTNINELSASNNMWCILEDHGNTLPETAPFLLSSNIEGTNTANLIGSIRDNLSRHRNFANRSFICITRSGAAFAVTGDSLDASLEQYFDLPDHNYRILHP